jgi:hypothetical protein
MYLAPAWVDDWWLWSLTPLTARMVAAWLLGAGIVLGSMAGENDRERIRPAAVALVVFGGFQFATLARFSDDLTGAAAGVIFAFSALAAVVLGGIGLVRRRPSAVTGTGLPPVAPA